MAGKAVEFPPLLTGTRRMFYAVTPNETTFESVEEVPNYIHEANQTFLILVILELVLNTIRGKRKLRLNDGLSNVAAGTISELPAVFMRTIDVSIYIWIYKNFHLVDIPWNNSATWFLCFIGVDMGYYWFHRMSHEVNIMWASHQVHHSSEDYNLSTAVRQSALQKLFTWIFYSPLALFIPPQVYMVHVQFNLLYQFWIHTEAVNNIGPLEYILNTPSHHRVHHGRNPYCIDKNYAGVLIIWDRMFGTFAAEEEEVVYGLVHPINTWDPIYIQFCHLKYMWGRFWELDGISNKLSLIFKGPGWEPGKPRLGEIEDIPMVKAPMDRYDGKSTSVWLDVYVMVHFLIISASYQELLVRSGEISALSILLISVFIVLSLKVFGGMFDQRPWAPYMEFLRCVLYLVVDAFLLSSGGSPKPMALHALKAFYIFSTGLSVLQCVRQPTAKKQD